MRCAITGAGGYLGLNLIERLLADGHEVRALDVAARPDHLEGRSVDWRPGDVLDAGALPALLDGCEVVFHLAARITLADVDDLAWRINTEGARNVANAALSVGVRRLVHCSSVHAFDQYRCGGVIDEATVRSTDPGLPVYDRSKYEGEVEVRRVVERGLDAVIVNPTGVFGPADYGPSRVNGLLLQAARGRVPVFVAGGFDFVDVRDVASGLAAASEKGDTGANYLLGGEWTTMLELAQVAAATTGRMRPRVALPLGVVRALVPLARPIAALAGSDLMNEAAVGALESAPRVDCTRARTGLGYRPRPAAATVRDLVAWAIEHGRLAG